MHHFNNLHQFLAMGGYARFVWPAYAVVAAVLIGNLMQPIMRHRRLLQSKDIDEQGA